MSDDFFNFSDSAPAAPAAAPATAPPADDFMAAPAQDDFFGGSGGDAAPAAEAQAEFQASEAQPAQGGDDFFSTQSQPSQQDPAFSGEQGSEAVADFTEGSAGSPTDFVPQQEVQAPAEPEPEPAPQEIPPLVKWQIQNREEIAQKDQVAAEKEDKIKKEATEVISQFYAERQEVMTANHDRNTGAEAEFCKQRDALFAHGEVWERVVSLIDLKAANDKKPQQRVARMRQLLLHMKNEAK